MITIKKAQYAHFTSHVEAQYIKKLIPAMKKEYPEKTFGMNDEELRILIKTIADRALSYKIELESDVYQFVSMDFRFGNKFEEQQKYKEVLKIFHHPTLTGTRKIEKTHDIVFKLD